MLSHATHFYKVAPPHPSNFFSFDTRSRMPSFLWHSGRRLLPPYHHWSKIWRPVRIPGFSGLWSEEMATASSRARRSVWHERPGFDRCSVAGGRPCRPKFTGKAVGAPVGTNGGDARSNGMHFKYMHSIKLCFMPKIEHKKIWWA